MLNVDGDELAQVKIFLDYINSMKDLPDAEGIFRRNPLSKFISPAPYSPKGELWKQYIDTFSRKLEIQLVNFGQITNYILSLSKEFMFTCYYFMVEYNNYLKSIGQDNVDGIISSLEDLDHSYYIVEEKLDKIFETFNPLLYKQQGDKECDKRLDLIQELHNFLIVSDENNFAELNLKPNSVLIPYIVLDKYSHTLTSLMDYYRNKDEELQYAVRVIESNFKFLLSLFEITTWLVPDLNPNSYKINSMEFVKVCNDAIDLLKELNLVLYMTNPERHHSIY
ncbi:MAG: hypothetical protein ATN36_03955 [Epulopiscium sp. Nele67-Bin005]|nr:MAG: hypothetical protein ATN36_03955 [Epulopiscium sp. Nele67-Bin005]